MLSITKDRLARIIKHAVLIFVLYLLQSTIMPRLKLWGVCPLILPFAAVGFGLFDDGLWGGIWGLISGLLCDISMGQSNMLFTVLLTFVGFLTGFFAEFILARGFPTYFLLSLLTLALSSFLQLFGFLVFNGVDFMVLGRIALFQCIYSSFFILPLYYPLRKVTRKARS